MEVSGTCQAGEPPTTAVTRNGFVRAHLGLEYVFPECGEATEVQRDLSEHTAKHLFFCLSLSSLYDGVCHPEHYWHFVTDNSLLLGPLLGNLGF